MSAVRGLDLTRPDIRARLNCMIQQGTSNWGPAIKEGEVFLSPDLHRLAHPTAVRMATPDEIDAELRARGEVLVAGRKDEAA